MYKGYHRIFWGLIIASFNINIGPVKILPSTIGVIMILYGTKDLYQESEIEVFRKAGTYAFIDVILTGMAELAQFLGIEVWGFNMLGEATIIFSVVIEMLVFYKIIEGSISYLEEKNQFDLGEDYTKKLRNYLIISLTNTVVLSFTLIFNVIVVMALSGIIFFILRIYLMGMIKKLRDLPPNREKKEPQFDAYV